MSGKSWRVRIGVVFILVALVTLGVAGWEIWGTTWQSTRKHEDITRQLEQSWSEGNTLARVDLGGGADVLEAPEASQIPPESVVWAEVAAIVRIPAFGDDYVVPVLSGTSEAALAAGFGHFEAAAGPGEQGNFALAGHRITHGEPLRDMPELKAGDVVLVETAEATYTYVLDTDGDDLVVPFTQTWVIDPLPTNPDPAGIQPQQVPGQRLITLTTCSELFHTDGRMIAFGHLLGVVEK